MRLTLIRKPSAPHLAPPLVFSAPHSTDAGSFLDALPDDALELILAALNVQSLCRARRLNKRTHRLAQEISLWRSLLCRTIATIGWRTRVEQLELLPMSDIVTLLQAHPKQHREADADVAAPLRRLDHIGVSSRLQFTADNLGVAYRGAVLGGNRAVRASWPLPTAVHDELRPLRTNEPSGLLLRALAAAASHERSESPTSPPRRATLSDASWSPSSSASSAPTSPATPATPATPGMPLRARCDGFSLDGAAGTSSTPSSAVGSPLTSPLGSFSAGSGAIMSLAGARLGGGGSGGGSLASASGRSSSSGSSGSGGGGESLCYVLDRGCRVGYFEVEILPVPADGRAAAAAEGGGAAGPDCVAVGLCTSKFALVGRQPGWDPESFGYHGDDGRVFHGSGVRSNAYGPRFGAGDVVGCGISLASRRIFYTLNGAYAGVAFTARPPQLPLHAVAGLDTFSPIVFNLGATPFRFDLAALPASLHAPPPRKLRVPRCLAGFGGALSAATPGPAAVHWAAPPLMPPMEEID